MCYYIQAALVPLLMPDQEWYAKLFQPEIIVGILILSHSKIHLNLKKPKKKKRLAKVSRKLKRVLINEKMCLLKEVYVDKSWKK